MTSKIITWIQTLQSIAQAGLTYSKDKYDLERYKEIQHLITDMLQESTGFNLERVQDLLFEEKGYRTPKIDVRGAVFTDSGKILLVQEETDHKWALPGGWADTNYSPKQNVLKEIQEESGLNAKVTKLISVHDCNKHQPGLFHHCYKLFFLCERIGGKIKTSHETLAADFFEVTNLPPLSTNRNSLEQIHLCQQHYLNPSLLPEID